MTDESHIAAITGRITQRPAALLVEEILEPQFSYEAEQLLAGYLAMEKVLLLEYSRLKVLTGQQVREIAAVLTEIAGTGLIPDQHDNHTDIAFAIERRVTAQVDAPVWHVDRSRNDLQACAQLMFGRERILEVLADLLDCATAARRLAARHAEDVLPGYTHLQAAQVITPGFFVSALSAHLLHSARRMLATYDSANRCPLGAGALAGQELAWDRDRMADLLGFTGPVPHALVAVASRAWLLEFAAECSTFGVGLSRLMTDLMALGSSEYGLIELPDELAGISSAMPQKKNYPILERIRGRTAHLAAWHLDILLSQRNTSFSNTVEVSKEGAAGFHDTMATLRSSLRLLTGVLNHLVFRTSRARDRCATEYLGGFSLANRLTLEQRVPWRLAQVIAGRYAVHALAAGRDAANPDAALLTAAAAAYGYTVTNPEQLLREAFDPRAELARRATPGSASPERVTELLAAQAAEHALLTEEVEARSERLAAVPDRLNALLGVTGGSR